MTGKEAFTMSFQSELWVILSDAEYDNVWNEITNQFHFYPSMDTKQSPFRFQIPVDAYDIGDYSKWYQKETINNEIMKAIFIECMGDDDFMYVLDWQHTCFKYNPRIDTVIEYPVFVADERYEHGGYNVYFPEFYPNGDYYFFIAKDFRWGYLTHPWLKKAWVFGGDLMCLFEKNADVIGFIPCEI
jgi:hypothetical protein